MKTGNWDSLNIRRDCTFIFFSLFIRVYVMYVQSYHIFIVWNLFWVFLDLLVIAFLQNTGITRGRSRAVADARIVGLCLERPPSPASSFDRRFVLGGRTYIEGSDECRFRGTVIYNDIEWI